MVWGGSWTLSRGFMEKLPEGDMGTEHWRQRWRWELGELGQGLPAENSASKATWAGELAACSKTEGRCEWLECKGRGQERTGPGSGEGRHLALPMGLCCRPFSVLSLYWLIWGFQPPCEEGIITMPFSQILKKNVTLKESGNKCCPQSHSW